MNKTNVQNKAMEILEQVCDIYEGFLEVVKRDVISHIRAGRKNHLKNLKNFGENTSVDDLIKLVVRGANLIIPLILKASPADSERKYLDEQEIAERTALYKERIAKIMKNHL